MQSERPWFTGLSRSQWLILLVAWMGWLFDIADTALFNFAKVPMLTEMLGEKRYAEVGTAIDGQLQSVFLVGWAVGGLVFGILADRWGRTRTLVLTIVFYCLFTGLTALCRDPVQVGIARFLAALGIGGEWAAGAALVAEALPDRARAGAASFIQSAAAFGPMLAALANIALRGMPWQWLFVVGIGPALLCVLIRLGVKEPEKSKRAEQDSKSPLSELWQEKRYRRHAIVAMIIGVVGIAGAGTAVSWMPNLVKSLSEGLPKDVVDVRTSWATIVPHIGTLLGVFTVPWLCTVIGRKRTIFAFFLAAPLTLYLGLTNPSYEKLLLFMPLVNFFAIGVSAAFVLYFPELFPTRMRATGAGLAYNVGRLLVVPLPTITGILVGQFGGPLQGGVAMAVIFSGSIYILGLLAIPFAPETKGKPLPE